MKRYGVNGPVPRAYSASWASPVRRKNEAKASTHA
jgi:hypothetical protein